MSEMIPNTYAKPLTKINSAQIVLSCIKFSESLAFFTEHLGFRVEMIFPADAPSTAVISGYDVTLRLETSNDIHPVTLRLSGDFGGNNSEITSPDGVRVLLINENSELEIPETVPEFIISTLENENVWSEGRAGMLYRDLIPSRLGGCVVASHISIPAGGEVPDYVHFHKVRFQMIYCISGWAKLVYECQGAPFVMHEGDCVLQPPEIRHRVLETSANFEVLEIGCPAIHETHADHEMPLPNESVAPERVFGEQIFVHHNRQNAVWEASDIENIESRDTRIKQATGGLADVCTLRVAADASFSVKHSDEFMFFFVLEGNLRLSDKDGAIYQLKGRESFVLPAGKEYRIDVERGAELIRVSLSQAI